MQLIPINGLLLQPLKVDLFRASSIYNSYVYVGLDGRKALCVCVSVAYLLIA